MKSQHVVHSNRGGFVSPFKQLIQSRSPFGKRRNTDTKATDKREYLYKSNSDTQFTTTPAAATSKQGQRRFKHTDSSKSSSKSTSEVSSLFSSIDSDTVDSRSDSLDLQEDDDDMYNDIRVDMRYVKEELSLEEMWQELEENLAIRTQMYQQLARGKGKRWAQLLWQDEEAARKCERLRLFHCHVEGKLYQPFDKTAAAADIEIKLQSTLKAKSWWRNAVDAASFEYYFTMPTVISLILHCFVHIGLYDILNLFMEEIAKHFLSYDVSWSESAFYAAVFIFGVVMMRFSSYLYWWSSDNDYRSIKFAYHNRIQCQHWDAVGLRWVKQRPFLQAALYTIGYTCVYLAVSYLHWWRVVSLFDNRDNLLRNLPSKLQAKEDVEYANVTDYLNHQEELAVLDDWFVFEKLSPNSYIEFWFKNSRVFEDEDEGEPIMILGPLEELACQSLTIIVPVILLYKYGFVFWKKY